MFQSPKLEQYDLHDRGFKSRQARETDLPEVADLDHEAFSPYSTAEDPKNFPLRCKVFPQGFAVLSAAYGCSEKWLMEREPGLDDNPLDTHQPEGKIFCISGMVVRLQHRGQGYGLVVLDHLIKIARQERCVTVILETTHTQGLYQKRGFQVTKSRTQRGISLGIMKLDLKDYT